METDEGERFDGARTLIQLSIENNNPNPNDVMNEDEEIPSNVLPNNNDNRIIEPHIDEQSTNKPSKPTEDQIALYKDGMDPNEPHIVIGNELAAILDKDGIYKLKIGDDFIGNKEGYENEDLVAIFEVNTSDVGRVQLKVNLSESKRRCGYFAIDTNKRTDFSNITSIEVEEAATIGIPETLKMVVMNPNGDAVQITNLKKKIEDMKNDITNKVIEQGDDIKRAHNEGIDTQCKDHNSIITMVADGGKNTEDVAKLIETVKQLKDLRNKDVYEADKKDPPPTEGNKNAQEPITATTSKRQGKQDMHYPSKKLTTVSNTSTNTFDTNQPGSIISIRGRGPTYYGFIKRNSPLQDLFFHSSILGDDAQKVKEEFGRAGSLPVKITSIKKDADGKYQANALVFI